MAEVRFYHLTGRRLEDALPPMLEKCLERGWRALVLGTDAARLEALDRHLWTWRADSFLAHGRAGGPHDAAQPILLATELLRTNRPDTLFLIDGAEATGDTLSGVATAAILFDGADPAAVERARADWRAVTAGGHRAIYWAETEAGGWAKKAESG